MFKCDVCGITTNPNEKSNPIYETRPRVYENYRLVYNDKTRKKLKEKYETTGYEITKEINACKVCFEKHGE